MQTVYDKNLEKSLLIKILGVCMGIFWVCFIIWNRLIRERLPRIIEGEPFTLIFWIILWLALLFTGLAIYYLYKLQKKLRKSEKKLPKFLSILGNYITENKIYKIITYYILGSPSFLWQYLYYHLPERYVFRLFRMIHSFWNKIYSKYFHDKPNGKLKEKMVVIFFEYLTRIFAFSDLLFEIVVKKELYYFYHIAPILLIYTIFISLRWISFLWYVGSSEFIKKHWLDIEVKYEDDYEFRFRATAKSKDIPEEVAKQKGQDLVAVTVMLKFIQRFYKITYEYRTIGNLIVYSLLSVSYIIWLLVIFKLY